MHDEDEEHEHDDRGVRYERDSTPDVQVEEIFGIEAFKQNSVGIDVGSSTSHLIFSELTLRREGFSSRFNVTEREVLFRSNILLTPYLSSTSISSTSASLWAPPKCCP